MAAEDLDSLISKLMSSLSIKDYKTVISGNSQKGDGYLGEVNFIKVTSSDQNFNLVVKTAKKNDELRKLTALKAAYDREIFMYTNIIPMFQKFQQDKSIESPFNKFPKCFSVCSEDRKEAIILQNVKTLGYELHDRQRTMNLDHVLLVMRNYGKFHALSLAMKQQRPELFSKTTRNLPDVMRKFVVEMKMVEGFTSIFVEARKLLKQDHFEAFQKFEGFEKEIKHVMCDISEESDVTSVILHGDCWNNNFMFKYQNSKPIDMVFLDLQISRLASPIYDLSYFLYSCADGTVLNKFDLILCTYYSSLCDFSRQLGTDIESFFPFKLLKDQWKIYGKYGLFMASFVVKLSLCNSEETLDLADVAEDDGKLAESFNLKFKNYNIYENRIRDVLVHYAKEFL